MQQSRGHWCWPPEIAVGSGDGALRKGAVVFISVNLNLVPPTHIVPVMRRVRIQQNDVERGLEGDCVMFSSKWQY